jgi:hypothetical protein
MIEIIETVRGRRYVLNGMNHRPNGPAVLYDTEWSWQLVGERHRYYGRCCSWREAWYIHGRIIK